MSDKKIHFVSSDNKAAKEAKDNLVKKYKDYSAPEADVIVALGGDGLMLQTLHDNIDEAKPIFGINKGSVGFLMNDYNDDDLLERIESATLTKVYPLQMTVKTEQEEISAKAINEVSLLRQTYQAAKIKSYATKNNINVKVIGEVGGDSLILEDTFKIKIDALFKIWNGGFPS